MISLKNNRGFSLIELITVIAITTIILSIGLIASFDSFNGTIFRSERSNIIAVLDKARSRSMSNYLETSHGVCLDNTSPKKPVYVNFQGTYSAGNNTNEYLDANPSVSITSSSNQFLCSVGGIVFIQLSGKSNNTNINISQNGRTSTVTINLAGRIDW